MGKWYNNIQQQQAAAQNQANQQQQQIQQQQQDLLQAIRQYTELCVKTESGIMTA